MSPRSSAPPAADVAKFFSEGGELGEIFRTKDWSTTPLGPSRDWPQSLLSAVSVMLTCPQPSYVFWGPELAILYNDRGLPFVGLKHPQCLGHSIRQVLKEAWPVLGPLVEGVMRDGTSVYLENLLIPLERIGFLQDGYFTFSYVPIRNEAGEVGGILVIVNETTRQVLGDRRLSLIREQSLQAALCTTVDEVLRSTQAVLAEAPADLPFALLYEITGDRAHRVAVAGLEASHRAAAAEIRRADPASWPLAEVVKHREILVVGDLATRFGALPGGPSGDPATRAVLLPLASDQGHVGHVLVAGLNPRYPFDDEARSFLQLLARQLATSIASTRALQEKVQRAEELAELDRQKTEFFSNVSHEFRTPLTLMLGPLDDAADRDQGLDRTTTALVHRNAHRLLKLVNNLLAFSRAEAGRANASYQPTDLSELTHDLASGFRSAIEAQGLVFDVACPASSSPTLVDAEMWEKIILNLLSNAFKFTFEGTIRIALAEDENQVVLEVSDTGIGIPETELPRLFERFHRVREARSRSHEGSGIGLALVADLARLHGGKVEARSELGKGSAFTVTIPRRAAQQGEGTVVVSAASKQATAYLEEARRWIPTEEPRGASQPESQQARVLVVEDNADMRAYLTRLLSERWTVTTAPDGAAALAAATSNPPDVIVSDMMMPGLDGIELVRALRADERTREVPFILLSARADPQSTTDALGHGASDYMIKPFAARELLARVGAQLAIAAVRRTALARLEALLLQAPAAIAVLRGPSLVFVLANERYGQIVGRRPVLGKPARQAVPELSTQGIWDLVDGVYQTGVPFVATAFSAALPTGLDGALEEAFFNWVAQPTYAVDGGIDGVLIFAVDVSEQVRARLRLEEARALEQDLRAAAEAANRAKDEFLAMLGHELRNPLAPISTALQILRLNGTHEGERERLVIERQVRHLEGLVSDLLDVSRIAQGKVDLKRRRLEIGSVLEEAIEGASTLLEERRQHLEVHVPPTGLAVDADPGRLRQVFANLVTNAAKYTEPGGRITVQAERRGARVVVEITDDGIGISAEMLPRIFDLFSQEAQSLDRSEGGLGLGLSIVRSLVELHGGRVQAFSDGVGRGSRFVVELPASEQAADAPRPGRTGDPIPASGRVPDRRQRILIVDDNEDAAELLGDMLARLGHVTKVAHDGPQALGLVADFAPTVALLDIGLPVMDGYELARRLRGDPGTRDVMLVAITGYGQAEDQRRTKAAGFDAHLVKPVPFAELTSVLSGAGGEKP